MSELNETKKKSTILDWIIRVVKGVFVGIGFITPGLSGGVLAVVFGIYEPLMRFLGNIREKFVRNFIFFFPVGIGGIIGVVAFSAVVDIAFTRNAALFTWLFIGFITGTFPSLFKTSGKQGRKGWHWLLLSVIAIGTVFLMQWMDDFHGVRLLPSFGNWVLSGALIGLGVVAPGLSPSNFLIYLDLYQPMAAGIRQLDFGVILPLMLGGILVVFGFAKLISLVFRKHYTIMYHIIIGVVVGSTIAIIPSGLYGWSLVLAAGLFVLGALASFGLAKLDEKFARDEFLF